MAEILIAIFLLFVQPAVTSAGEQTTFRDSSGRTTGTATSQGDGTVKFRDAQPRSTGSATTDPSGQTKYYDASGKVIGTSNGPVRAPFPERR
jgi:hypothetical protein